MAFKTAKEYNESRFNNLFLLRNDGDSANVVFLYPSWDHVLIADVHYIKSSEYTGYVHCCGAGCPACGKNIRVQNKLFIPLYNVDAEEIQFFDRSARFENQLKSEVFDKFANPSEYVFSITRHGQAGSVDTSYEIRPVGRLAGTNYAQILADSNATFPDFYNRVCRDLSIDQLSKLLYAGSRANESADVTNMAAFTVTPRPVSGAAFTPPVYADPDESSSSFDSESESECYDSMSDSEDTCDIDLDDSDVKF